MKHATVRFIRVTSFSPTVSRYNYAHYEQDRAHQTLFLNTSAQPPPLILTVFSFHLVDKVARRLLSLIHLFVELVVLIDDCD